MNSRALAVTTVGFLAVFSASAQAGPRDDILEAMGKCATIKDNTARLGCYDALSPRLHDALNIPPATLSHPPTKEEQESWFGFNLGSLFGTTPQQQTTPQQFGSDQIPAPATPAAPAPGTAPAPEQIESITAKVTEYSFTPFGKFIVFLGNGQVWRQIQGDSERAHFHRTPSDNTVRIERGAIGSYNLFINESKKIYKVTRIK